MLRALHVIQSHPRAVSKLRKKWKNNLPDVRVGEPHKERQYQRPYYVLLNNSDPKINNSIP